MLHSPILRPTTEKSQADCDAIALRNVLRRRFGRDESKCSDLLGILEGKKCTSWVQKYNRLVEWSEEQWEELTWRTIAGHAAFLGLPITLEAFLELGMNAELRDDLGRTLLHRICQRKKCREGHREAVKILRSHGARIKLLDNYGRAPVSLAGDNGHFNLREEATSFQERPRMALTYALTDSWL